MNVCYHYYDGTRRHLTVESHLHLAKTLVLRLTKSAGTAALVVQEIGVNVCGKK